MTADPVPGTGQGPALKAYGLLTFTALCWGANAIFGRIAAGEISPMFLVSVRWAGVFLLLMIIARRQIARDLPVLRRNALRLALLGTVGFTTFNAMFYVAAYHTTALNIGIVQGAIPVFMLIGAFVAYGDRITLLQALGVAITIFGVAFVAAGGSLASLASLSIGYGDGLIFLAGIMYAAYGVGLRNRLPVSPLSMLTGLTVFAFLASLPLMALEFGLGYFHWPTTTGWLVTLAVTLFPSFLAQIFFIQAIAIIGPGRASVFINLVPVFAAVLAVTFLGETFHAYHGVALALVLAGIWLSERGKST